MTHRFHTAFALSFLLILSACTPSPNQGSAASNTSGDPAIPAEVQCLAKSPWLGYGEGLQASSASSIPTAAASSRVNSIPACDGNSNFLFGAAKADITGPAGGKIHMGNESPENYSAGIYMRQYARSFVVVSPCNNKRVVLAITDTGMLFESVRKAVLDLIAADPELAPFYNQENIMMSATHTHSTPGGQAHFTAFNALRFGHDTQTFDITVAGLFKSIKDAHQNLLTNPDSGQIMLNQGELTGANKNRAIPAYMQNSEVERALYLDKNGNDVDTPRLMTLLKFVQNDGDEIGSMNWFGVHPTSDAISSYGLGAIPISGDNKGYAAYQFERSKTAQNPNFVSAFMQAEEGDSFTQMWFDDDQKRAEQDAVLPPNEPNAVTVANGQKQLLKALTLYANASGAINGPVDYRFGYVQMDQVEVTDQAVLESLIHPAELDAIPKRTCNPAMGVSFPAAGHGAQPGEQGQFTEAGINCSDPDAAQLAADEFRALTNGNVPASLFAATVGCNAGAGPDLLNLSCHAEKPILLIFGPPLNASATVVPFQLFRIGNLAVVGLPWEITTMAGRRIRQTLIDVLKTDGIDYVVINGLSNDYVSYLTTREEYALQMYESASNQFGPWSLAAVQQETRRLALDMVNATSTDAGPTPPVTSPQLYQVQPSQGTDQPNGNAFGDTLLQPNESYEPGNTVRVDFQSSSPNSDLKTGSSFLFVEHETVTGSWEIIYRDADPETTYNWRPDNPAPQTSPSSSHIAEILWRIPRNTEPGTYRIRFEGVSNQASLLMPYEGSSNAFEIAGPVADCP